LRDGIIYLARQPTLLYPLLLTFVTVVITTPSFGLLAAVVHKRGGSIISLGLLGASVSLGHSSALYMPVQGAKATTPSGVTRCTGPARRPRSWRLRSRQ